MLTVVVAMAIGLAVMTAWLVATRRRLAAVDVGEQ